VHMPASVPSEIGAGRSPLPGMKPAARRRCGGSVGGLARSGSWLPLLRNGTAGAWAWTSFLARARPGGGPAARVETAEPRLRPSSLRARYVPQGRHILAWKAACRPRTRPLGFPFAPCRGSKVPGSRALMAGRPRASRATGGLSSGPLIIPGTGIRPLGQTRPAMAPADVSPHCAGTTAFSTPHRRSCTSSEEPCASSSAKPCVTSMRVRPAARNEIERTTAVFHTAPRRHNPEPRRLAATRSAGTLASARGCQQSPQCH
jgi:hypothetical protein